MREIGRGFKMAGEIFISMTGDHNELWAKCQAENLVAIGFDTPFFDAWRAGDYEEFWSLMRTESPEKPDADVKANATLWFNRAKLLSDSENDIWFHRAGTDLYWAKTTDAQPVFEPYGDKVMIAKPVSLWSRRNAKTVALAWNSIHPKGRDYLVTQQAIFRVANDDMRSYLHALVQGDDLEPWHDRQEWRERLGEGKSVGKNVPVSQFAIERMLISIKETVKNANGQIVLKALKNKKLLCSDDEMKTHLADLMVAQQGKCKLTGLTMHLDGEEGMEVDLLASADRIDSNGHYEIGNIQLVCRFANYWKCAQENGRFVELLERIIQQRLSGNSTV